MDPVSILRISFLGAAIAILFVKCVPPLRSRFLAYGSRDDGQHPKRALYDNHVMSSSLNALATIKVPHSWFTSFYVVSTTCSLLWASQLLFNGSLFQSIALSAERGGSSMTLDQVVVTWLLMFIQGGRRLYECLAISKSSSARMWIGHWLLGIWFYASMSVSVWIEGSENLLDHYYEVYHFVFSAPTLRTFVATLIFILASGVQYDCHSYLASLKTYKVPEHPVFNNLVCPHYFAECLIYLSLAIVAAPPGYILNRTILCALVFVTANLGITAAGTKTWYAQKFGSDGVNGKWRMVPFVY
ncbi:hypothetical protein MBLNU459_g1648t1 [Dothideomycetes sp. NU459]